MVGNNVQLRPYQKQAVKNTLEQWSMGNKKTLLHCATGTGKTVIAAEIAKERIPNGKVLFLAHRGELLQQAHDKIYKFTGIVGDFEQANRTTNGADVVIGSVQTMMTEKRLSKFEPDTFKTIIVDEAHHAVSQSYRNVLDYFSDADVVGITATADRADKKNLGQVFDSVAFEYSIRDAVKDGYLVPIKAQTIPLNIDISTCKVTAGDFQADELGTALDPYLEQIALEMKKYCGGRRTMVFTPLIKTSEKFVSLLRKHGFKAAEVNGNSPHRKQILEDFSKGKYDVLVNSMLLTEGFDEPSVDCIICLRPTKSRGLYTQMIGRGTRLCPETGKNHVLVLDFLWLTEKHDLCHPACLIAESPEVQEKMTEMLEDEPEPKDLEQLELDAERSVVKDREEKLAQQLKEMRTRKRKLVDPLQFAVSIGAEDLSGYEPYFAWEKAPATAKQLKALEKAGIYPDEVDNAGKAKLLLDRLTKRRHEGLSTPKQIRFLEGRGFLHVGEWSFQCASKMIGNIADNNWRIPNGIVPSKYNPEIEQPLSWGW